MPMQYGKDIHWYVIQTFGQQDRDIFEPKKKAALRIIRSNGNLVLKVKLICTRYLRF